LIQFFQKGTSRESFQELSRELEELKLSSAQNKSEKISWEFRIVFLIITGINMWKYYF